MNMNKLFWKFLINFFNFQHILSIRITKSGKIKINYWIFLLNLTMPFAAYGVIIFVSKDLAKFMDPNVVNMQNISLLCVRIMRVFPILTIWGIMLVLLVTLKSHKVLQLAKKLSRLVKLMDINFHSELILRYEMRCFVIWMLSQPLLMIGSFFNIISVIKMQLDSLIVMISLTWTRHSSSYIILICIFTMNFFATLFIRLAQDIVEDKRDKRSFDNLRCIGEIFEEFRLVSDVVMSMAFTKLLVEILIFVIKKKTINGIEI